MAEKKAPNWDYRVQKDADPDALEQHVIEWLNQGYAPVGGVAVVVQEGGPEPSFLFAQAMVKPPPEKVDSLTWGRRAGLR